MDQQVETVKQEIQQMVSRYPMQVTNAEESAKAKEAMVIIRKEAKDREKWFKANILDHAEQAYKQAKKSYDAQKAVLADLLKPFTEWERTTSSNILTWEAAERKRVADKQKKEMEAYQKRVERAEAKGKDIETVKPPTIVESVPTTHKAENGGFTVKKVYKLDIIDESIIPDAYLIKTPNKKMIEAALRGGVSVPGCMLREELQSAIRV